jgi:hypothetical protein
VSVLRSQVFVIERTLKTTILGIIPTGSEALSGSGTQKDEPNGMTPDVCLSKRAFKEHKNMIQSQASGSTSLSESSQFSRH